MNNDDDDYVERERRKAVTALEKWRQELLDLKRDGPNVATRAFAREALLRLDRIIEGMRD